MKIKHAIHCQKVYTDETVCEECELYSECTHETQADIARLAISALEKQIPKKPVKYGDTRQGLDNNGNSISWQEDCYECPNCESFLGYVNDCKDEHYQDGYCRNCGQAIDWSE